MKENREVMEKFVALYCREFGISNDTKIEIPYLDESCYVPGFNKKKVNYVKYNNLSEYIAHEAYNAGIREWIFDTITTVLAYTNPISAVLNTLAYAFGQAIKEKMVNYEEACDLTLDASQSVLEEMIKGNKFGTKETVKSLRKIIVTTVVDKFIVGRFRDTEVFQYIRKCIDSYYISQKIAADWKELEEADVERLDAAYEKVSKMRDKEYEKSIEEKRAELSAPFQTFVEDYITEEERFQKYLIIFLSAGTSQNDSDENEYYFRRGQAEEVLYYKLFKEAPGNHEKQGITEGRMAAFTQVYSYAMLTKKVGGGHHWTDKMLSHVPIQEWENADSSLCKMSVWNSCLGSFIGAAVINELDKEFNADRSQPAYHEKAREMIEQLSKAAIETGIAIKSVHDPRVEMVGAGAGFSIKHQQENAQSMLRELGNLFPGKSLISQLKNHLAGNTQGNIGMTEMMDHIMANSGPTPKYRLIHKNDISKPATKLYEWSDHGLLQLVTWSHTADRKINWDVCDPVGDPYPGEEDPLDYHSQFRKLVFKRKIEGKHIQGTVYKRREGNRQYIIFNELSGASKALFDEVTGKRDIRQFADIFLKEAFDLFTEIKTSVPWLNDAPLEPNKVVLLGYGAGGAIAGALSAALFCGAFTKDGYFDGALAHYGWSLDKNGEIIDNVPAETVNTVTFAAPPMGWLFQKPDLCEIDDKGNSVYEYEFRYPESKAQYTERIRDAPVTHYGMACDRVFAGGRGDFPHIGRYETFLPGDGVLSLVKEPVDWHSLDAIELAFQKPRSGDDGEGGSTVKDDSPPPPQDVPQMRDPLIIDLNRDGKVSTTAGKRYFDMDANGIAERVSWAASGDGFLVLDRDGDGVITSGLEMFGDSTVMSNGKVAVTGFQALADLDSNGDGVIDARDELFSKLRVWADGDGDGVFGNHELYTLEELGIESIGLRYAEESTVDENGNRIVRTGKVTWKDGDTSPVSEFLLVRDTVDAKYERIPVSEDIAALPDLPGRGNLFSLHQAMARDGSGKLKELVQQFVSERDSTVRRSLLDKIMVQWEKTSDFETSGQRSDWLKFIDKFYGGLLIGTPDKQGWRQLESNYEAVSLYLYGKLLRQTHYADLVGECHFYRDEADQLVLGIGSALKRIAEGYTENPDQAKQSIAEFFLVLKSMKFFEYVNDDERASHEAMLATYGAELVDAYRASYMALQHPIGEFTLPYYSSLNSEHRSVLDGDNHNNVLVGGDGPDTIRGGFGSDILIGGKGDDVLIGGEDSDIYIWNLGDGNDMIINSTSGGEIDVLRLGKGIHPGNVRIERYGNTIRLVIGESGEVLTLATDTSLNWRGGPMNPELQIARVEFAEGTVWSRDYMHRVLVEFHGTDGADTLEGSVGDDVIYGGKGDDILRGGRGSDTYVWRLGDGNDIIEDGRYHGDRNTLRLEDVAPSSVKLLRDGNNLLLIIAESGERITLPKWYNQWERDWYRLHAIEFSDGTVWSSEDIGRMRVESTALVGTDGDDVIDGTGEDDVLEGRKGKDLLRGGAGSDTYIWNLGDGNDTIEDQVRGDEANVLRFGEGITRGMVTFRFRGDDMLVIITAGDQEEIITLSRWETSVNYKLARIEFADGTHMTHEEIDGIAGSYVSGTEKDDVLYGSNSRHVTFTGGKGDDVLYGGARGSTYVWNPGDGSDVILNSALTQYWMYQGSSFLEFGEGVTPDKLSLRCVDDHLLVTFADTGEVLTIRDWYTFSLNRLQEFRFADGTVWNADTIEARREKEIAGTDGDDTLVGYRSDDILIGGKGNDLLKGGGGDDVYVWNLGDGNDTISDTSGNNTLQLGPGICPGDLRVSRSGNNLCITVGEKGETIMLESWMSHRENMLVRVLFDDGTVWTVKDLENSIDKRLIGTDGDDILNGYQWDDVIIGGKGNDILRGGEGHDTYIWNLGDGNDVIEDYYGRNRLQLGKGITPQDVHLRRDPADHLVVTLLQSGETITLSEWFRWRYSENYEIVFDSGEVWGPDTLGKRVDRWIIGTDREDCLIGTPGDDFIVGKKGDDTLKGGFGNDTYVWELGDGNDTIDDYYGANRLLLGAGVNPDKLCLDRKGNDLVLTVAESGERLTINNWFLNKAIEMSFDDGTRWDKTDIYLRVNRTHRGTDDNDTLRGYYDMDEVFIGGKGDDKLNGVGGENVYIWNLGDGNDIITDSSLGKGTLRFGEGVDPAKILLRPEGGHLVFVVGETGERITVAHWRADNHYILGRIEFADGTVWKGGEINADILIGTDGNDFLGGVSIYVKRDETIIGGKGDDILEGGFGSDTYIWNLGDGNDTIYDVTEGKDINILRFGEGVDPAKMRVHGSGENIAFIVGETGEAVTVRQWRSDSRCRLYRIEFADGTVWEGKNIDTDTLWGTDASDTLTGTFRDEILIGGKGDDTLRGGGGNDTYIWNPGDGNDTINDSAGANTLVFGEGVTPDDIRLVRYGSSLAFQFIGTGEQVTVTGWYWGRQYQLYEVRFADGTVWDKDAIAKMDMGIFGTEGDDHLVGTDGDDRFFGLKGDDILEGGLGDDTYEWNLGDGNDTIRDNQGATTVRFGADVAPEDICVGREGVHQVLLCMRTGEKIRIEGKDPHQILFQDGTVWTQKMLAKKNDAILGTDGDDYLRRNGPAKGDVNHIYIGGKGNDVISSSGYNDTYIWNLGDGNDILLVSKLKRDDDPFSQILKFGEGILPDEVYVSMPNETDLCLVVEKTGEQITVKDWHKNYEYIVNKLTEVHFEDGTVWSQEQLDERVNTYKGTEGNDTLNGYDRNDALYGGKGNDRLFGHGGDDTLVGGEGNDYLDGGEGHDIYIWNSGDGDDIINDSDNSGTLRFGEGVSPGDITLSLRNGGVLLSVGAEGSVLLQSRLTQITFSDGTNWPWQDVVSRIGESVIQGTGGDDRLEGTVLDDIILGGKGDDVLLGGKGDDTYIWNPGDGSDTITDAEGRNILKFGDGVRPSDVTTSLEGSALVFNVSGGGRVTVTGWVEGEENRLAGVHFADGTVWTQEIIRDKTPPILIEGTDEDDWDLRGTDMNDIIAGRAGDDTMAGGAGNDIYLWNLGDGNDVITDTQGKNALHLGAGICRENIRVLPGYYSIIPYSGISRHSADITSRRAMDCIWLVVGESGERIALEDWHQVYQDKSFEVRFEDGSVLTADDLKALLEPMRALDTGGFVNGHDYGNYIEGSRYSDALHGGQGNDTLVGGPGDDYLSGHGGDDTYIWNLGDGNDEITDTAGLNTLRFGEGVNLTDLSFGLKGRSLLIFIHEGDRERESVIYVHDWSENEDGFYPLQQLCFVDGTVMTSQQINEQGIDPVFRGTVRDDEWIWGTDGEDTLLCGAGDDNLYGDTGADTYIWNIGDGNDSISDTGNDNVLLFGQGINVDDVKVRREDNDLILWVKTGEGGSVRFRDWFTDTKGDRFGEVRFADGTVWTYEILQELSAVPAEATEGDDLIWGTPGDDVLHGYGGNDVIRGNDGDDTLIGGKGDDLLFGGGGDDTYIWSVGDGNDIIEDEEGENVLCIEGVSSLESVKLEDNGSDLIICVRERNSEERITVKNWLVNGWNQMKEIRIGAYAVWSRDEINSMLSEIIGTEGNDILEGRPNNHDDILIGRGGDDILMGGGGNDTYIWNPGDGNDRIIDDEGHNVLSFGEGVLSSAVRIERDLKHLYFVVGDERIQVENWFVRESLERQTPYQLSEVRFADGTAWSRAEINEAVNRIVGTEGEDSLSGYADSDNTLIGGAGDDSLYGGGGGRNTFIWKPGDGNDRILDASFLDTLQLGEGVFPGDVRFERDVENLYVVIGSERITVVDWFKNGTQLGRVRFADETVVNLHEINKRVTHIKGTDGNDVLMGYDNTDDVLEGGKGDDTLYGGGGNDTYIWNIGDGNDTIIDSRREIRWWSHCDTLKFGPEIGPHNLRLERDRSHLYVVVGDERITLDNWFGESNASTVRRFVFHDGTEWNASEILALACRLEGTDKDETLQGYDTNDTLIGGKGEDILMGGKGNDTYIWNIGDGNDRIVDSVGSNRLVLGDDVYSQFVKVDRDENHLYFFVGKECITVENWFKDNKNQLSEVRFFDGVVWSREEIHRRLSLVQDREERLIIRGGPDDDDLKGTPMDDRIYGGGGNDRIQGGPGNDKLYGGEGNDTYIWREGDGNDTILDSQGFNTLEFGEGIGPDAVKVTRDNQHLYITYQKTGERITVESWYAGMGNKLGEVRFACGTVWNTHYIDSLLSPIEGSENGDSLLGYDTDDTIFGYGGDDIISGRGGNDTIIGGPGNDRLYGGAGDDVYIWEPGHGSDRIRDGEGNNTLRLKGIAPGKIKISRDANNLYFHMGGGETLCVEDWFRDKKYRLASVEFEDGACWTAERVEELLGKPGAAATEGDDVLRGTPGDDVLDGLAGDDVIYGGDGNDLIIGGRGHDTLYGEGGDDTYFWNLGDGNDIIVDNQGRNRLKFGEGIDWAVLKIAPYGMDLMIRVGESGEYIRIADWFKEEAHQLAEIEFADGTVWTREKVNSQCGIITGTPGNDILEGSWNHDLILGGDGDDCLYGRAGNDSLVGGKGNDYLEGGAGDDSYIWSPGDGNDRIYDWEGHNVLQIGEGIDPQKVERQRSGNDLVLVFLETGERITVTWWFMDPRHRLAEIRFADGTVWSPEDIDRMPSIFRGTERNDRIEGSADADIIYGNDGHDVLYGYGGNDTIVGGKGDDYLDGGDGNDTYIWNPGDGNDTIHDAHGADILKIGEGVNPSDVSLERSGTHESDIVFVIGKTGERITVKNWFVDNRYQLSQVEFADGSVWTRLDIMQQSPVRQGTEGNDVLYGTQINDTLMGYGGDDHLYGYDGKDTLIGGKGDDRLEGGAGDDTYIWDPGDGNDTIIDREGANVLCIGGGVSPESVEVTRTGDDLIFVMTGTQERITVKDWYRDINSQLAQVRFDGGRVWTREEINARRPLFKGTDNDDVVTGSAGNDQLYGYDGNDTLFGGAGDDILEGGKGDDILDGGAGDDTYIWNLGDGNDRISDNLGRNVLQLGAGVDPLNIELEFAGDENMDLRITIGETGESITVAGWKESRNAQLAEIRFADGTVWTADELKTRFPGIEDRDGDDILYGTEGDDRLYGYGGNDKLYGYGGDDVLYGGDGDDELYGGEGNDRLIGGSGSDYLDGGSGNDTYIWKAGHGNDVIYDSQGSNVLEIGPGVDPEKVRISRNNRDLYLLIAETGERITVKDWYYSTACQLSEIRFDDGTVWDAKKVNLMTPVLTAPEAGGTVTGFNTDDILMGGSGNDKLYGNAGNDTLEGGRGGDYLDGGLGDDTYIWNLGDGNDTISDASGRNVLKIGGGIDPQKIRIGRINHDLHLIIGETGERITVKNWHYAPSYQLAEIHFADGTIWDTGAVNALPAVFTAPEEGGVISGFNTDDVLMGGPGDDKLYGYGGNDILEGGKGDDYLDGGTGDDTYIWNVGDGNDIIEDEYGNNILKFTEGVRTEDVDVVRSAQDLLLKMKNTGEVITVRQWFHPGNTGYRLSEIQFADGSKWTADDTTRLASVIRGTDGDDILNGFDTDDTLYGGAGDDKLYGGSGNDILEGGKGDDILEGGLGDDTYIWNLGDGNDTITDSAGRNTLKLGEGIRSGDIEVIRSGQDLHLKMKDTGECITVRYWYRPGSTDHRLSEVQFADGVKWTTEEINRLASVICGTDGDDTLNGFDTDDTLYGGAGDDKLYGGAGNDILEGGKGDDILEGGPGDDTYIWNLGDGSDTVKDNLGRNTLRLGKGVDPVNIEFAFTGDENMDLRITIGETGESITVTGWMESRNARLAEICFVDGTVWTAEDIKTKLPAMEDREGNDILYGTAGNDRLYGYGGNDKLYGYGGNDVLYGGDGDDELYGGDGNDRLIGGSGNDYLEGGSGNDTYVWETGHGNDVIYDSQGNNILEIGVGVDPEKVRIGRNNRDLYLLIAETGEWITIRDWYYSASYRLSEIRFAGGTVWDTQKIGGMVPVLTAPEAGGTVLGFETDDTLLGGDGNDTLYGGGGNDTLVGGKGDDHLEGGSGDDTYIWNLGDGSDTIVDYLGSNVLQFGEGVRAENIDVIRSGYHLRLKMRDTGETITVHNWYYSAGSRLSEIRFADGSKWTMEETARLATVIRGTDTGGIVNGYDTDDTLYGGDGNDTLYGRGGNDTLVGGKGDDRLEGGSGDDTYIWNLGDGSDTIVDYSGSNVLQFGEGVRAENIDVIRSGDHLRLKMRDTGEIITVHNWYRSTSYRLSEIRFADGSKWTKEETARLATVIRGTDTGGIVNGYDTDDTLYGGDGNDTLYGRGGNDTLVGGKGDDHLEGGSGDDTYIWNLGDGSDTIVDYSGSNVLQFGEGVCAENIDVIRSGYHLRLKMRDTDEIITVHNWYYSTGHRLSEIRFADGSKWTKEETARLATVIRGTDGNDTLSGFETNDTLYGGDGNDTLYGGDGNDTLVGGKGDDHLEGGSGDDTYIWNLGDGSDRIADYLGSNVLQFGEGVRAENIDVIRSGNHLRLKMRDTGETITVHNWYYSAGSRLSEIRFADGSKWTKEETARLATVIRGTDTGGIVNGYDTDDTLYGGDGNDTLYGRGGNDTLVGGKGDDHLEGGSGDDTYIWNLGDGSDTIVDYSGNNVLQFGEGVCAENIDVIRSGYHLRLKMRDTDEIITVHNWYYSTGHRLSEIRFADGSKWTKEETARLATVIRGTDGNDTLYGGDGNDTLVGGKGDDHLEGGSGDDTYIWNLGDGSDTIVDSSGSNVLQFGEGVRAENIDVIRSGYHLRLKMRDTGETITVHNWYYVNVYRLSGVRFADGEVWSSQDIDTLAAGIVKHSYANTSEKTFAMLSAPIDTLMSAMEDVWSKEAECGNSGDVTANRADDTSWASYINNTHTINPDDYEVEKFRMDIALTQLNFDSSAGSDCVCENRGEMASAHGLDIAVTVTSEQGACLGEEKR